MAGELLRDTTNQCPTIETIARLQKLRRNTLKRMDEQEVAYLKLDPVLVAQSLRSTENVPSWQIRRGILTREILSDLRFEIDEAEMLIGRIRIPGGASNSDPFTRRNASYVNYVTGTEEQRQAADYLKQYPSSPGQTGHCELDLERVMREGINGIRAAIKHHWSQQFPESLEAASADLSLLTEEWPAAYQSFLDSLDGLSRMILNAAEDAERAMIEAVPERKQELGVIAESCRRIANDAPETFGDAIQLIWFVTMGVMHSQQVHLIGPGHIDRILRPFYEADTEKGMLNQDQALEFICNLYFLLNDYIADHLAIPVMVGGRDAQGKDLTNDLSYLCLEALRHTRLVYPTVGICWHEGTPLDLVNLAVEIIGEGCANPAFFGDGTIQKGLKSLGVPANEACNYINSTCVEITPSFSSNVWVASPYFSVCKMLIEEIEEQSSLNGSAARDFESFFQKYLQRLAERIAQAVEEHNEYRRGRRKYGRKPLQSVFTRDCIARGKDIDDGGALYNWIECSFVGLANLADSLEVIRNEIFKNHRLSFGQMKSLLGNNFDGQDSVRQRFLQAYPKYGNDNSDVDSLFGRLVGFVRAECAKHSVEPDNSSFVPGAFCWIMHQMLGADCGATPDGRRAGTPFADGCGPAQGRETCGPTAAILSTTSWDHSPMIGGLAFNMKFSHSIMQSPQSRERLRDLILTYLRRGGFETQINVVNAETLRKAKENPEDYRDLVVRIGGYTDYFTRLSPQMQNEVIQRTEYQDV